MNNLSPLRSELEVGVHEDHQRITLPPVDDNVDGDPACTVNSSLARPVRFDDMNT